MKDWIKIIVNQEATIRNVLEVIDRNASQIALVVDADNRLLGTVTDGDVRRGLLRGVSLDMAVSNVMFRNFAAARIGDDPAFCFELMRRKSIKHLPVLDKEGHVLGLKVSSEFGGFVERKNWVVLMAGGLGTRLQPLTNDCPKPMLLVGGKPILQIILENFANLGFYHFFIAINYKAGTIENYFGDGSRYGVKIEYLRENEKLGTAGALSLLPGRPEESFFVMNGDLLTKLDLERLLDFHQRHGAVGTMCVREYQIQVPFGVVNLDGSSIRSIDEKPNQTFFVNAGIYVLSSDALDFVPKNTYFDMTTLFDRLAAAGRTISAFPIFEYWIDIGQIKDYEKVRSIHGALCEGSTDNKQDMT